jgi:hypothetical protein
VNEPPLLHGGCLCGAVRYQVSGPLGVPEHCYCSMCRKAHGAAFSTNAVVAAANLHVTAGAELLSEYESSPNRRKCFCSTCGSQLFIKRTNNPEFTIVTLGTVDGEPNVRAERHVFVASKASWVSITDSLPQFRIYPGFEPVEGKSCEQ